MKNKKINNDINFEDLSYKLKEEYEIQFESLVKVLRAYNPVDLIEYIVLHTFYNGQADGESSFLEQGQIEFLFGVILSIDFKESYKEIESIDLDYIATTLKQLQAKYIGSIQFSSKENRNYLINSLKSQSAVVRGDCTPYHLEQQLRGLFKNYSDLLLQIYGFDIEDILFFIEELRVYYENKLNEFKDNIIHKSAQEVDEYYKLLTQKTYKLITKDERKFKKTYDNKNKREVLYILKGIENINNEFRGVVSFEIDEVLEKTNIKESDKFLGFLNKFSTDIGDSIQSYKFPLDNNIYIEKPILKYGKKYVLSSIGTLIYNLQNILENGIKSTKRWENYQKNKGNYLESEVIEIFEKMLPNCNRYDSLKYTINDNGQLKECELDGLIIYDNNILIVESKSGIFHDKARKGHFKKLETNIKDNIESAYLQADRARTYIKSTDKPVFKTKDKKELIVDMTLYQNIYLLNVTLENFSEIATMIYRLKEIGLYKQNEFPWSVNINDLKIISDFIQFPSQFLHYLKRRFALINNNENNPEVFTTDELDFLGEYLNGNLYFNDFKEYQSIMLENYSPYFSEYYNLRQLDIEMDKIGQTFTPEFKQLIDELELLKSHGYSEIVTKLLDLSSEGRDQLIETINFICLKTLKDKMLHDATLVIQLNNPNNPKSGCGISIMTTYKKNRDNLLKKMEAYCKIKKYQQRSYEWIGIGIYVDDNDFIANELMYFKGEETIDDNLEDLSKEMLRGKMIRFDKVGRNDPCPCGSGKKYKKCHG